MRYSAPDGSSQPTYEGLKQVVFPALHPTQRAGSQPTYEGLKLALQDFVQAGLFGSQPTYEGLKLDRRPPRPFGRGWFPAYL